MCQHYQSHSPCVSALSKRRRSRRTDVHASRAHVTCAAAPVCSLSFFFFSIFRANLCACLYVCVCGSLRGSPHERPARPRTMRWASAEETHLCPTPTNRKPLSHPPRPAFASQARRKRHGEGKCNHATQRHRRALWESTYVGFSRGCNCMEKPMNVAINWALLRHPAVTPR